MKTLWKVVRGLIIFFLVLVLLLIVFQKVTRNKLAIGNIYIFQVASGSMVPEYKIGDIIVVQKVDSSTLNIGDNITYMGKYYDLSGLIITHKIVDIDKQDDGYHFITKGIANEIEDPEITEDDIYGKVVYKTVLFSFVGRLMTNVIAYYLIFIIVGVGFSYEIITSFIMKEEDGNNG